MERRIETKPKLSDSELNYLLKLIIRSKSFEIKDANEKFENYIESLKGCVLQGEEITVISNYNGDCSTLYSEFSF